MQWPELANTPLPKRAYTMVRSGDQVSKWKQLLSWTQPIPQLSKGPMVKTEAGVIDLMEPAASGDPSEGGEYSGQGAEVHNVSDLKAAQRRLPRAGKGGVNLRLQTLCWRTFRTMGDTVVKTRPWNTALSKHKT